MLGVWDDRNDDTVIPRRKMREFTTELALSLEQYEQKMVNEIKGHDLEMIYQMNQCDIRINALKDKTVFQQEAFETALIELKLK